MADDFETVEVGLTSPGDDHVSLTVAVLSKRARGLYCYDDGTITIRAKEGGAALPYALTAGMTVPVRVYEVTNIGSGTFYGLL
jgi:hypothetical protein